MTQRIGPSQTPRWATSISIALCLPLLLLIGSAALDYEPPFVPLLNRTLLAADGTGPTAIGRVVMLALLLSAPAAFAINLLAMRRKRLRFTPHRPTPSWDSRSCSWSWRSSPDRC
jgi:hypothetical protein